MTIKNASIPYKPVNSTVEESFYMVEPESLKNDSDCMSYTLDTKYSKADLYKIAKDVKTLNTCNQPALKSILCKHKTLFDGTLGHWQDKPYEIELKEGITPHHCKPFPVPHAYEKTLKMEVERLCKIGVLKRVNRSEWASPYSLLSLKRTKQ